MGRGTSGGGHSSGGHSSSSSHSSGGRMSSSGRGSSSYSSGRGSYGGGSRSFYNHYDTYHRNRYYRGRGGYEPNPKTMFLLVVIFITVVWSVIAIGTIVSRERSITESTIERTKLESQYTTGDASYIDELNWIRNSTTVKKGLKSFYDSTGVCPILYITDTVNGTTNPTSSDMEQYSAELYNELCSDEGHILFLFQCLDGGTEYNMWYTCGAQAKTVMDEEACNILMDYIDSYFVSNKSEDDLFADAFRDAGKRIMKKTTSPIVYVVVCVAVIALVALAYIWWKKYKAQKNLEAKQTAEILNTDIETLSNKNSGLTDLENRYK